MENREQYEELRTYKNRAWQAEAEVITKRKIIIALLVILLLIFARAFSILGHSQFAWRIQNSGFIRWFGRNNEYRIIFSQGRGDNASFVKMRRNRLGFWFARDITFEHHISDGVIATWIGRFSHCYGPNREFVSNTTAHMFYFNTNAISVIHINSDILPPNTVIQVRQWGNSYLLHATGMLTSGAWGVDFPEIVAEFTTQQ